QRRRERAARLLAQRCASPRATLAAVSAPCWRWGRPAWSRRRGSLLSAFPVPDGLLERHLDGVPVGAGVGRVGGDAVLYGGGVLRGELPGLDRLPRHTLSSQQVVGEIEGGHCGILRGVVCRAVLALLLLHPVVHGLDECVGWRAALGFSELLEPVA